MKRGAGELAGMLKANLPTPVLLDPITLLSAFAQDTTVKSARNSRIGS